HFNLRVSKNPSRKLLLHPRRLHSFSRRGKYQGTAPTEQSAGAKEFTTAAYGPSAISLAPAKKRLVIAAHGRLALVPKHEGPQVFHFTSTVGLETRFFLRNGLFVFLGDQTTFRPDWAAFTPPDC